MNIMTVDENFRQTINLDGLAWTESICLPARLLTFLREEDSLDTKDKLIILRLYTLLQFMDPDIAPQLDELCSKLGSIDLIDYQPPPAEEDSPNSAPSSSSVTKISLLDCGKQETLLMPLFNRLYPEMKNRQYGYQLFIQGELMGWLFPRGLLHLIKFMELSDAQRKKKNVTNHFILSFIFQLVFRDQKFIPDDYFVAGRQLNINQANLNFALAKTCFEHHELGVDVLDGKVIAEIIETETTINGDDNNYESATRLYYQLKYGEKGDQQLTDKSIRSWETQWKKIVINYNITIDEILNLLPKLFSERKPEFVPTVFSHKENDPGNSLGSLLVMMRNRRLEKKKKNFNVLNIMGTK